MPNEFVIKNGYFSQGNSNITGSLTVTGGVTASLQGTASYSTTAATASYILNAVSSSYALTASYYAETDPVFVSKSGSFVTTSSFNEYTGSAASQFAGTASYSINSATASYYAETDPVFTSVSGSFTTTSSFNSFTSSYATGSFTGSFIGDGSGLTGVISSSYAVSSSYATNALSASYATTASIALTSLNASDVLIYVKNVTGAPINKGTVVRINGATGDNALIVTASYEADAQSANTLGILNETIANDSFGYAMTEGSLIGIDTSTFTAGQLLYLGTTGSIIGYEPVPPLHAVRLGQALRIQSNNGSMYVRIDNGYELDELHNVLIISGSDGDLLVASGSNGNGKKLYINSRQLTGSYGLTGSLDIIGNTNITAGKLSVNGTGSAGVVSNFGVAPLTSSFTVWDSQYYASSSQLNFLGPYSTNTVLATLVNKKPFGSVTDDDYTQFANYLELSYTASDADRITLNRGIIDINLSSSYTQSGDITANWTNVMQRGNGYNSAGFTNTYIVNTVSQSSYSNNTNGLWVSNNLNSSSVGSQYGVRTAMSTVNSSSIGTSYLFHGATQAGTWSRIQNAYGLYLTSGMLTNASMSNYAGVTVTGNATGSVSNALVLLGTGSIPAGNWSIYNSSSFQNYFRGWVGINKETPTTNLDIIGDVYVTGSIRATTDIIGSFTGSLQGTASYASNSKLLDGSDRATFATTGSNEFKASQIITGSLTITNDLVVLGSSSIQYITSSQLDITTNIISVNTYNPAVRFGGLAVIDSGSSPQTSGSLLFDSQNNQWIFVHQDGGSATTSSVLIMGPQTFNDIGNEGTITTNRLTKGTGGDLGEHIGDSNITDTGTKVSINSNTEITGSVTITNSLTVGGTIIGNGGMSMSGSNSVTGSLIISGSTSTDLVRITQTGTGNAFVVEDSTNPDATPFVIGSNGNVGIGVAPTAGVNLYINNATTYGISSTAQDYGVFGRGNINGIFGFTNGATGAAIIGFAEDSSTNIGIEGYTNTSEGLGTLAIGGKFTAQLSVNNYSVQLIDGTETVAGRFLINQTTDGKANWGKTIPDIQITGAITGSTGNNTSTDAMIQSALLYLSNNC